MKLLAIWGVAGAVIGVIAGYALFLVNVAWYPPAFIQWLQLDPGYAAACAIGGGGIFVWRGMAALRIIGSR